MLKTGYEDYSSFKKILGIDEVGYGCGAGDLYLCGVVLPQNYSNKELNDSKKIKNKLKLKTLRDELINNDEIHHYLLKIPVKAINEKGIGECLTIGVNYIINKFEKAGLCDLVLVDGINKKYVSNVPLLCVPKGDEAYQNIAGASIIAKATRDEYMVEQSFIYPEYGFETNAGYLTEKHRNALKKHGKKEIHREVYVRNII